MKKPMPLILNDKTNVWLRNYMDRNEINNDGHIHVIKGDLHSDAFESNLKYTYRNVISLFGDSDYSQMNYPSNGYGVSYEILTVDKEHFETFSISRGTFTNL